MIRLRFLGAAGTVTGSCYFLQKNDEPGLVVDCGIFQGTKDIEAFNYQTLQINAQQVGAVVLTHAHLDHCGRLPILTRQGYTGKFFMTQATYELIQIALFDAVHIAQMDKDRTPLYAEEDVIKVLDQSEIVDYGQKFNASSFRILMRDAGHILGSTSLEVTHTSDNDHKIIFSGDIGNYPQEIVRPTEFITSGDIVVMESTYGGKVHPDDDPDSAIMQEINEIEKTGGTLLIPSFAIQRTQEILYRIRRLKANQAIKAHTAVFLDSPMAIKVTKVYQAHSELFNNSFASEGSVSNFDFSNLHVLEKRNDAIKIKQTNGPKVIIAGSGMMSGGRILNHAAKLLPNELTRLLIVGYQGDDTLGRAITEGVNPVKIDDAMIPVRAHVRHIRSMSAHADEPKLIQWLKNIQGVQKIVLTHGDEEPRAALKDKIQQTFSVHDFVLPHLNEEVVLVAD
jgi:metallo-beta-lactamase family protein